MAENDGTDATWYLLAAGLIMGTVALLYILHKETLHYAIVVFEQALLYPFSFVSQRAQNYLEVLQSISPGQYSDLNLSQLWEIHTKVFRYFWMWICAPICGYLLYRSWGYVRASEMKNSYVTRQMGLLTLMRENVKIAPCIAPAVQKAPGTFRPTGKSKNGRTLYGTIMDKPYDNGPWRTPRNPVQFAVENKLLLDKKTMTPIDPELLITPAGIMDKKSPLLKTPKEQELDTDALEKLLRKQIGPEFGDPESWQPQVLALAGALLLFAKAEKGKAQKFLDDMSLSFTETDGDDGSEQCSITPSDGAIDAFWELFPEMRNIPELARHESFLHVWMMALLDYSRKKGVLPSFYFLWLRPIDRDLWYAMHQVGGRAPWCEALAPWAHWRAEVVAGKPIEELFFQPAIDGLYNSLAMRFGVLPFDEDDDGQGI